MKRLLHIMAALAAILPLLAGCKGGKSAEPSIEFATYVKAYTGGTISSGSAVRIEFVSDVAQAEGGSLFSFSPSIKGSERWLSPTVVEFTPEEGALQPGTSYKATFRLGDVVEVSKPELKKFQFGFRVAPKVVTIASDGVQITADDRFNASVSGTIRFSEPVGEQDAAKMVSVSYPGLNPDIELTPAGDGKTYAYKVAGLLRASEDKTVTVEVAGASKGYKEKKSVSCTIPSANAFKVIDAALVEGKDPYVEVYFSEPIDNSAAEKGFVTLSSVGRYYSEVKDNRIKVYYDGKESDGLTVAVSSLVKSLDGTRLGADFQKSFASSDIIPEVQLAFSGNILPDNANLVIPFQARGLNSVEVRVVRIYEDNILMFLQDNDLDGQYSLRRSGRLVYKQTINLTDVEGADPEKLCLYTADLSNLFNKEPGAIYRIGFVFGLPNTIYASQEAGDGAAMVSVSGGSMSQEEIDVWDEPSSYYYESYYDWDEYNYEDCGNPRTPSFYMDSDRYPTCNLLTSNVGIISKSAGNGKTWVAVSDIMTTDPMGGAEVTAYSYQLQPVGKGKTDSNGFVELETSAKPFVIMASKGKSVGYLKVADGEDKSLSRFDTGGQVLSSGLKGFVYGERGVWRPGDTLHVSIMVEDRDKVVPEAHPVTMELYNPQGQFYAKQVCTSSVKGLYVFNVPTRESDPTGTWNAYFKVGGATFHKSLPVETVKANRLKVNLYMPDGPLQAGKPATFSLASNWLTGPAAAGLKSTVEMTLSRYTTSFKGYEGYTFDNPVSEFTTSSYTVFEKTLDAAGKTTTSVTMPRAEGAPGMLKANFVSRVMEAGGDASITTQSALFAPYSSFVGVKLPAEEEETDKDLVFPVVVLDANGNAVAGHKLEYRVYKLTWSWWWESSASSLDSYVNGSSASPVAEGTLTSVAGKTNIPFRVEYPEWGRYLVYVKDLTGGHASGGIVMVDWPSWRGRSDKSDPDALTMLSFTTDRKSYQVGDQVTVYIPGTEGGRALVSLENGRGVISRTWVKTSGSETTYKFNVTREMTPNIYIHITLIQPHQHADNDLPIRMYGVQPVLVDNKDSRLQPVITAPEVIRPQEEFSVKVKEQSGKPMTYTLAIVDEGLLDLTNYKTPDPWKAMNAREALGVRTWDLYDKVIGAYSGRFSPMFSIGGDEDVNIGTRKESRFNPVVKFYGPFTLARGEKVHKVTLPMYVGSVRVMVVAGQDGAYGSAEKAVPVRTPLMVLPTLPRVLGTGEKVTLPVNVFAMEDNIRNVLVSVSVDGPLTVVSDKSESLAFTASGDKLARFSLASTGVEGVAKVTVTATSGSYKASETINIEVRNPNAHQMVTESRMIKAGGTETFGFEPFEAAGDSYARLQLTTFPAIDFDGLFSYVKDYSYDCTEQLASKGMTLVYTKQFLNESNAAKADEMVASILQQLYARQLPDGGFAYWPGSAYANEWATSMAGQFLAEASAQGYNVNRGVLASWRKFQKSLASNYKHTDKYRYYDLQQAYRLYSLAVAGNADEGAMNRLKAVSDMTGQARWRLAAAYAVAGKKNVAKQILANMDTALADSESYSYTFGSSERDKTMQLETAVLIDEMPTAMSLAEDVADTYRHGWFGTQYTAFAALAMNRLAAKVGNTAVEAELTGASQAKVKSAKSSVTVDADAAAGSVKVKNTASGPVYASLQLRRPVPYGQTVEARSAGISVAAKYTDLSGKPLNPQSLRQGQDFKCTVVVSDAGVASSDMTNLALSVLVPSGWEIFNERLFDSASDAAAGYSNKDIRDDRVIWYFDLPAGGRKTFTVRLQAAYEGEFVLPAVVCEAMYDPEVHANTASAKAIVAQ